MDDFDKKIVAVLQTNGRFTNQEVAQQVGLSHSSCSRRISRLEKEGVIVGYRALTDRHKLGLSVRAFCGVSRHSDIGWDGLAEKLSTLEGVVSVFALSGDVDVMLEIVASDMQSYSQIVQKINKMSEVNATSSSFVLEEVKTIF